MRIATSLNVFENEVSVEQMFERCRQAGFEAVDFNYTDRQRELARTDPAEERALARRVRAASAASGLPVLQMHGPIYRKFSDDPESKLMHQLSLRCFDFAAEVGCPWVVFEPDTLPGSYGPDHQRANLEANAELFGRLAEAGARAGTGVAVENVVDSPRGPRRAFGATPAELLALLEAIGRPNVGICWDTGHAHLQGLDQRVALAGLGRRVVALHVADNDRSGDQHLLPYMGSVDWPGVMAGLREAGYQGAFAYEAHNAIRRAPDAVRDGLLAYAARLARWLVGMA